MSYNDYLECFGKVEEKIETFKETIVNSKEFVNAFLDLTDNSNDDEKNTLFEALMITMGDVCKDTLK